MILSSDNNTNVERILREISLGDKVTINDWGDFMEVVGISPNYIALFDKNSNEYSIVCKKIRTKGTHNGMIQNTYCCGPDDRVFGYISPNHHKQYNFENKDWICEYLNAFENEDIEISEREGCTIFYIGLTKKGIEEML